MHGRIVGSGIPNRPTIDENPNEFFQELHRQGRAYGDWLNRQQGFDQARQAALTSQTEFPAGPYYILGPGSDPSSTTPYFEARGALLSPNQPVFGHRHVPALLLAADQLGNADTPILATGANTEKAYEDISQPILLLNTPNKWRRDTQFGLGVRLVHGPSPGATDPDIAVTHYKRIHVLTTSDIVSSETNADPTILRAYIGVYGGEDDHKELIACAPCIKTVYDVELKKPKGQKRRNPKWLESTPMSVSTLNGGTRGTAIVVGRQREFDFSRGKAEVKLRICCNCKHLGERAFRLRVILVNYLGHTVGAGFSNPILIVDDHTSTSRRRKRCVERSEEGIAHQLTDLEGFQSRLNDIPVDASTANEAPLLPESTRGHPVGHFMPNQASTSVPMSLSHPSSYTSHSGSSAMHDSATAWSSTHENEAPCDDNRFSSFSHGHSSFQMSEDMSYGYPNAGYYDAGSIHNPSSLSTTELASEAMPISWPYSIRPSVPPAATGPSKSIHPRHHIMVRSRVLQRRNRGGPSSSSHGANP